MDRIMHQILTNNIGRGEDYPIFREYLFLISFVIMHNNLPIGSRELCSKKKVRKIPAPYIV